MTYMNQRNKVVLASLITVGIALAIMAIYLDTSGVNYSEYSYPLWSDWDWKAYDQIRVKDLNGDLLDDLVISGHRSLEVLFQNSTGQFENRSELLSSETYGGFVLEDINGDGSPDICCRNGSHHLMVLLNDGFGAFIEYEQHNLSEYIYIKQVFSYYSEDSSAPNIGVHTLGQDPKLLLMNNNGAGHLSIDREVPLSSDVNQWDLLAHDFNNDESDEIAVIQNDGNLTVFSLNKSEKFYANVSQYITPIYNAWLINADIDGNGNDDIGFASNIEPNSGYIVFFSVDSGTVILEKRYPNGWNGANTVDLDGDSDLDIVLCTNDGSIIVFENKGTGLISSQVAFTGFISPRSPEIIELVGKPSPAIIFLAQSRESHHNLIDVVAIWRRESKILS